ncbi:MAG: sensor histidine kinase, partial [Actinobacteria bacterium]|nr:sensor histidine kinase [Actinomycetota bacterium]
MVKPSILTRWSGPASMMGTVLLIVQVALSSTLGPGQGTSNPYEIYDSLLYVVYNLLFDGALLLFAVGLVGLHARRIPRSGRLGRMSQLLALGAGALVVISVFAALAVILWPRSSVLLVLFTQLSAIVCLVIGLVLLGLASVRTTASQDWISGLGRRGVLLILGSSLGAALLSDALERIINGTYLGLRGNHLLHVLVTIPVAAWVARKAGTAPVLYGVVVGLISGIANQIFVHAILYPGSMSWYEITVILVSCVGAGGLGGFIGRATLAEQETLYRASQAIGVVASLQDIVDAIGEHLADPQVSHVALWRGASEAEDETSIEISLLAVWMPLAARVWGPGVWRPGLRLDTTQVPALKNLRRQSPLVLRTRKLPASERAVWEHQGIRSAVLLPLITSSGARVGLLMVASRSHGFSRVKERTYLTIGAQVALVLENLRLIEQAQQAGVSSERQRLAQEIHDTLAGAFTSIVMKLEAAEESLNSDRSSVQRFLDQARGIARESLAEARRLMWALRPESLERSSLSEALANLAERWSEECGVDASATVTGTPHPLPPDIEVTLMRVAQEALTNCRKYAQARQVTLTLSYMNNLVALNVQDDGVGFDPAEPHPDSSNQSTGGFGIMGMRERVEQLRGTLLVESAFGEGTTLMVAIPVAQD